MFFVNHNVTKEASEIALYTADTATDSDHAVSSSQVKKGQTAEKKALNSGQLFSDEQIRFVVIFE